MLAFIINMNIIIFTKIMIYNYLKCKNNRNNINNTSMTEIYSNDNLKIVHDKKTSLFRIEQKSPDARLINSLIKTRIIQGGTATDDYRSLKFKAFSVKTLKQFQEDKIKKELTGRLTINEVSLLIEHLSAQLKHLIIYENHTILGYNAENIIVIDESKFAYIDTDFFIEMEEDNKGALVSFPFDTNDFFVSPELLTIKTLPSYVHYKTSYFSLACLAIYVLLYDTDFYKDYIKNNNSEKILEYLNIHPIKSTKIYWLLSRCFDKEPDKRSILYI